MDNEDSLLNNDGQGQINNISSELPEIEKERMELNNKRKYSIEKLKELRNLFRYLENKHSKNRHERKQFRKDLVSDDTFSYALIDNVIEYFESGVKEVGTGRES